MDLVDSVARPRKSGREAAAPASSGAVGMGMRGAGP